MDDPRHAWQHLHWSHRDALKRARQFERLLIGYENVANVIHVSTAAALVEQGHLRVDGPALHIGAPVQLTEQGRLLLEINAPP